MRTFKDNAGRTWTIAVNVAAVKRVRGLLDIDLYKLVEDGFKPLSALLADPVRLVDVLFCLCKEQADTQRLSDEDFGKALGGDAVLLAAEAFLEELTDFFPNARVRAGLRKVWAAGGKVRDRLLDHVETALERIDPEREANRLIASFGGSPGSSDSTPAPSRSASS